MCWARSCGATAFFWANRFGQMEQAYGFSPVWVRSCRVVSHCFPNCQRLGQNEQLRVLIGALQFRCRGQLTSTGCHIPRCTRCSCCATSWSYILVRDFITTDAEHRVSATKVRVRRQSTLISPAGGHPESINIYKGPLLETLNTHNWTIIVLGPARIQT